MVLVRLRMTTSLVPAAERYTSVEPDRSIAAAHGLYSSMNSSLADAADPVCTSLTTTCLPAPQLMGTTPPSRARSPGIARSSADAGTDRSRSPPPPASSAAAQPPATRQSAAATNRDIAPFYHGF